MLKQTTKYLVLPVGEDGEAKLPESLGAWDNENEALSHAQLMIMRDKTNKSYFVAEVRVRKNIQRFYKIYKYTLNSTKSDILAFVVFVVIALIILYEIYVCFPFIQHTLRS